MSELIRSHRQDSCLFVQINRPEKKNALTNAMYARLAHLLSDADENPSVRVLIVHGVPGCFTAGNDLRDFMETPPTSEDSPVLRFLHTLTTLKKPLIAQVEGMAIGIGTTMLLHCDLVYAGDDATFQMPFTSLGLVPEAGSSLLLPQLVGLRRASELLLLGKPFDAATAHSIGLINAVLPSTDLAAHVQGVAQSLAALPLVSIQRTKDLLRRGQQSLETHMREEIRLFVKSLHEPAFAEAARAFMEKRAPDFLSLKP